VPVRVRARYAQEQLDLFSRLPVNDHHSSALGEIRRARW
jgi:hypothetical protein